MSEDYDAISACFTAACMALAVIAFSMSKCEGSPPAARAQIECIKQRGDWKDGNCTFSREVKP
jgi:hypothetical protein